MPDIYPRRWLGVLSYSGGSARAFFDPSLHDGLSKPWIAVRDRFRAEGCELIGADSSEYRNVDFEIHVNAHEMAHAVPAFSILTECNLIWPSNANTELLRQYRGLFTWMPELVEAGIATKIQFAHSLGEGVADGYARRPALVVMIAANKALPVWRPQQDLYRERRRAIRWFERHAPAGFTLYGHGWDKSARLPTKVGGAVHRLEAMLPGRRRWFPSWRGAIASKRKVLEHTRFSLVYENVRGLRGYITEKIFDAFCAGNVPIYWGAEDIIDYIPPSCFIDRRQFESYAALYEYLSSMPEKKFIGYQQAICQFLASDAVRAFSTERFAETIVDGVLKRLSEAS